MNPIVTTSEIKSHLGITSSAEDAKLDMWNKMATEQVAKILGASALVIHQVTDERHDGGSALIELNDMSARKITGITIDGETYTQSEEYDIEDDLLRLESVPDAADRGVKVSYIAGWFPGGWATVKVTDNSAIVAGKKITIAQGSGTDLVAGTDFTVGATAAETAANIAAAANEKTTVTFAYANGDEIVIGDMTTGRLTTTWAYDGSGITAAKTLNTTPDMPEGLRLAVLLLIAGIRGKAKAGGMSQYTIGGKHVQFASAQDANQFKDAIAPYERGSVYA